MRRIRTLLNATALGLSLWIVPSARAEAGPDGLLFRASADSKGDGGMAASAAAGDPRPNFVSGVTVVPDGATGPAFRWDDDGYVTWNAPGNIYAQRGTLAFFWRPRTPVGAAPFVLFRTGFADHSSWDMAFLRIDWNGHGFDAFVTDANLARVRVSWTMPKTPSPTDWHHIAFGWDETRGVVLWVDGIEVARKDQKADLDSGLDQFGLAGRIISPHQVQSRYSFMRGSDIDEIRVYDHLMGQAEVAALAGKQEPVPTPQTADDRTAWLHRYGWDRADPPVLDAPVTTIRKVEFADAKDLKSWMWKGVDGIPETTWPGVYNRSRLPGRDDYFELPDWNVYVEGGKRYDLTVPEGVRFNRVELRGAAYGSLDWTAPGGTSQPLAKRPQGVVRSVDQFAPLTGGTLHFTNVAQEQPIQELWAYDVGAAPEPAGTFKLAYRIDASAAPDFATLGELNDFIAGRFPPAERATVVARPASAGQAAVGAGDPTSVGKARRTAGLAPVVHVLIPSGFAQSTPGRPLARAYNFGWANLHDGLDGVAIDLPALDLAPDAKGLIPLNIQVMDPLWPGREMADISVSVRPHDARTVWLDLRDRILPAKSLYLRIASANPGFSAQSLDGAAIRLVFKDRAAALPEHIADRFNQVKDNWGFLVEEHTASGREALYRRVAGDITDLLRVDPENKLGRIYWADINYSPENMPAVALPPVPAGVPAWAFRQVEDLKLVQRFVDWWIDKRQVPYGDFGGGISDDTDLTQQWPGLALMGVEPERIEASLRKLDDASFANGMRVDGLAYITTDELHAYEEGLNSDAERLYLDWGEPLTVERLMQTAKAVSDKIVLRNPAGHMHFASNWYGGRKVTREGVWEWQKPYSFTVMHAPILVGLYNRNPVATGLVTGVIDGLMAHGKPAADGTTAYPNEINWRTDATRKGDGGGLTTPLQSAWAAWRFTGDAKYLVPIESRIASSGAKVLAELNENAFDALPDGSRLAASLSPKGAGKGGDFGQYAAWASSGDTAWLTALHAQAFTEKTNHEYLYTEGQWWSDRVEQPSEILQRERLGGVALKRNQTWPGHSVSWRFAEPDAATQVAILLPHATRNHLRVIAFNLSDHEQRATMTGWNVAAGTWRMTAGTTTDDGKSLASTGAESRVALERGMGVPVTFAPRTTTVLDFTLVTPGDEPHERADAGIGRDDVALTGRSLRVTVHSLGAKPIPAGEVLVERADGTVLARTRFAALPAPLDLLPQRETVRMSLSSAAPAGARVRLVLDGEPREVTMLNNSVALSEASGR
ncbi:MAG: LamG domain-containing protein [Novosphingobium sp.]